MAIKKVLITDGCLGCQACVGVCPAVFQLDAKGDKIEVILDADLNENKEAIKKATNMCPAGCIKVIE